MKRIVTIKGTDQQINKELESIQKENRILAVNPVHFIFNGDKGFQIICVVTIDTISREMNNYERC